MQAVGAFIERLALDGYGIAERDGRVFVGSCAPNLAVGDKAAPDPSAVHQRAMVVDGDVGNPDALAKQRVLAGPGKIQNKGLRRTVSGGNQT